MISCDDCDANTLNDDIKMVSVLTDTLSVRELRNPNLHTIFTRDLCRLCRDQLTLRIKELHNAIDGRKA